MHVTVYAKLHILQLLLMASRFVNATSKYPKYSTCKWIYRNKSQKYFHNIMLFHGGVMKTYLKDDNGDPACPITGQLKGLFFSCNGNSQTAEPLPTSPFGTQRLVVPAGIFMFHPATCLYFADFYCRTKTAHWVTVVLTVKGSKSELMCQNHLIPLEKDNNPFLYIESSTMEVKVAHGAWVELIYTEDIDILEWVGHYGCCLTLVPLQSHRQGPQSKRLSCTVCNLFTE